MRPGARRPVGVALADGADGSQWVADQARESLHGKAAGQGIASRLYDVMEAAARQQGITSLFTEASELARRLFERKGFTVVERQDLVVRGVAIHNYRMAKTLDLTHRI
jgi:ribosomal protein S18 acetylase RimI-like enzyme